MKNNNAAKRKILEKLLEYEYEECKPPNKESEKLMNWIKRKFYTDNNHGNLL